MLRNEGLHQEASEVEGVESAEHAPGLAVEPSAHLIPLGVGGAGADAGGGSAVDSAGAAATGGSTSVTSHGENQTDGGSEPDPHNCREWPCPKCHKPRDADDDTPAPEAAGRPYSSHSAEAAAVLSTQSFFHTHEPLKLEPSEDSDDEDLLLNIMVASSSAVHGAQSRKSHCS